MHHIKKKSSKTCREPKNHHQTQYNIYILLQENKYIVKYQEYMLTYFIKVC